MNVYYLAKALGGDVVGPGKVLCPGPGHSAKDRSLSVTASGDHFTVYSFAGDDWQVCRDHVRSALGIPFDPRGWQERHAITRTFVKPVVPDPKAGRDRARALDLWQKGRTIGGTIVQTYLQARGIIVPDEALDGHAIRFHPSCPFGPTGSALFLPAMVAAVVDIRTNEFLALHRTALLPDGSGKAKVAGLPDDGRMMLASSKGGVVKLSADEDVAEGLHIGEGIETCLAGMATGFRPMWSALNAGGIAAFPVLAGISSLTIFADNDASGTGEHAAHACAQRWVAEGREVRIFMPPETDTDFADVPVAGMNSPEENLKALGAVEVDHKPMRKAA